MNKYTFRFSKADESEFNEILSRLEEDEFTILAPTTDYLEKNKDGVDRQTIIEMDAQAALTFRLGMKHLKIERERTEEEKKEREDLINSNIVTVKVKVNGLK
jgi:hypothetical protein